MTDEAPKLLPANIEAPKPGPDPIEVVGRIGDDMVRRINTKITAGVTAEKIRLFLGRQMKGRDHRKIPSIKMLRHYVAMKNEHTQNSAAYMVAVKEVQMKASEIREDLTKLAIGKTDVTRLRDVLRRMMNFIFLRAEKIQQFQEAMMDIRFENTLLKMFETIHKMTQTLLSDENTQGFWQYVARLTCGKFLKQIIPIMKQTAEETMGDAKAKVFMEAFQKRAKAIDYGKIEREAQKEAEEAAKDNSDVRNIDD